MGHQDIFQGRQFVLEFPVFASYKQKQLLKEKITKNNGIISYTVTRKTDYVIRDAGCDDSSYRIRIAVKYGVKVVTAEFLDACLEKGKLVDSKLYIVSEVEKDAKNLFADGKIVAKMVEKPKSRSKKLSLIKTWLYKDRDGPIFHNDPYTVVKAVVLKGKEKQVGYPFCVIEIHCNLTNESEHDPCLKYCVFTHQGVLPVMSDIKHFGTKTCRFMQSASEALDVFDQLYKLYTYPPYLMTCSKTFPSHEGLGSDCFHIEDWLLASVLVEAKVAQFIADIWTEVACVLDCTLSVSLKDIQENQIVQAESLLFDISKALKTNDSAAVINLSEEFYKVLHHQSQQPINSWSLLISEYNLCQLVKDFLFLQESITLSDQNIIEQQYFSLHCDIQVMENGSSEYQEIASLILDCKEGINLSICNIFRVHRTCEDVDFTYNFENKKLLFHGTKVENVVGILSRGMLLSEVIFSNPENADHTNGLGAGLYFTDELSAASKFSFPGKTTGRRLLLISEVALGECYDIYTTDQQLTSPPVGYNSVRGVKLRKPHIPSDFEHNEYVIYNINQQRLKYVVEFCQPSDVPTVELRPPTVDCSVLCVDPCTILSKATKDAPEEHSQLTFDVQQFLNKHNSDTTSAVVGLQSEYNDPVPLKSVHVRAKLIDLAAEVVIMQEYINDTETTIEARYVFPLDDKAAVCGFEAFSNGQHFIGRIEEKKEAQMEYKQAVESGKRAYLMDEEAPDVFKVSIGNVKPHSSVLVKIRYVTELDLDGDLISFRLPGSVSPWQQELGLKSELQSSTKSADVSDVQNINTSLELFVDMPFDIKSLYSPTHEVNTKKTASHAVVTIDNNVSLNSGFQLIIGLSEIHVPRMWVEKHPKFDSSACMLTFYPEFVSDTKHDVEVILALDASNSMTGSTFSAAQQISILCLHYLPPDTKFNVLVFGSIYYEAFPCTRERSVEEIYEAQEFILRSQPALGSSKISHFLQSYIHLKPEANTLRSIYIITDGYLQELNPILQNASKQTCHTRIFCLGVGKFVNHHLLNKISHAGAGSYEYFDEKSKSKWASKAQSQMLKAEEPVLTDVKVEWQQFDDSETEIIQAPQQINSVFSGSRVIVYGFVPNCSLAVLKGNASGTEVSTMVFTSELGKSTGSTLHCLTTKALVRDWESGFLDQVSMHHEVCKRSFKSKIVALSKQYSIITPLTSFVAVEEKDNKVAERYNGQPSIGEFIQDECVDFLQYLNFQAELSDEEGRGFNSGGVKRHRRMLDDSSSRSPSRSSKVDSSSKMLGKGGRLLGRGGALRHRKVIEEDEWRKLNAEFVLQHQQTDMLSGSYSASINSQGAVGHTMSSAYEDDDDEDMGCGLFDGPAPNSSRNHMQLKTLTKACAEHNQDTQNKFVDSNITEGWQVQRSINSCKMLKKSASVRHRLACPPPPGVCYSPNSVNVSGRDDINEGRLAEVERIMTRNIMKVLERDAKLSELDDRADSLICGASQFERRIPTLMSANACAVRSDVCAKPKLISSKKQTTVEEFKISSISFGAGLPFFSLLLKHFASNMDLDNHKTMKEQIEDMLDSFPVSENFNSEGGINIEHLSKDWNHHLWSEIQLKLVSNGINSMGSAVRDSILSLIATISFLLVICQKLCSDLFPLDLTNLSSIQNVAHKITVEFFGSEIDLCTRLTCMKSLLFITSVNQRHPLVYRTLELGNSWEEAFYFLTNGQNLIEIRY